MPESLKKLQIFAASPSDVASERAKLETVVESLKPMADYLGLILEVVDWRAVVPDAGRPQQTIFDQLKPTSWDIFIGILWHRFGTPPGATNKTGKEYLSGTEEEFKAAYELWKQHGKPRIVIYRCTRSLPFDIDPDQLRNVRAFFKLIEDVKGDYPALYQTFDSIESFEKLVLNNLQKLLVEYGEEAKTPVTPEVVQVYAPVIPNNLPRRQAFFGRTKEMETVMRALSPDDRTWGILVDGIGGIGKSAIAIEAAYRVQEAGLFEAFVFVTAKQNILEPSGIKELNPPAHTLDEFLNETTRVLGQPGIAKLPGEEKRRALIDVLRSMRTLLIYDNLETLSKEEQEGIADFLRELPQGSKAIITSRRRGGEGGVWLRLEKLDWDAARGIIKNQMSLDIGLANKLNRVGETRWQELFDETNGSPLALVHTLGLMRVRAALSFDGTLEMLRGNRDDDLQKFIFREASKELTENDKAAIGALSFFVPSATFEAWLEVAGLTRYALTTTIDRLSAMSLVDMLAGEENYSLHPLTRTFARSELLTNAVQEYETGASFAKYWVDYAKRYGGDGNYRTYDRLEVEWLNLDAAANWLWEKTRLENEPAVNKDIAVMLHALTDALCGASGPLFFVGRWDDCISLASRAYEALSKLNDWGNAGRCAYNVAWIYYNRFQSEDATLWADRCTVAWGYSGGKHLQAAGIRMLGMVAELRKDFEAAKHFYQESLSIFRSLRNNDWSAILLNDLGSIEHEQENYDAAQRYYLESLELSMKIKDREGQAVQLGNLGGLALDQEQWAEATKWFQQALPLMQEVGRQDEIARIKKGLARVYKSQDHLELALQEAQDALKIYERLQHEELANARELVEILRENMKLE